MPEDEHTGAEEPEEDEIEARIKEMHAKTSEVADKHRSEADFDEDMLRRMDDIAEKARGLRAAGEKKEEAKAETRTVAAEDSKGLGLGFTVAYTIVGVPLLGIGIGWFIDRAAGTTVAKGLGAVIGMVVGVALVMTMINRTQEKK